MADSGTPPFTFAIPTNTATPRPSLTPTWTPLPTLLPKEAELVVEKLISANGFCNLPCIGGFTPGETRYAAAKAFFSQVAEQVQCDYQVCEIFYHRSDRYPFLSEGLNLKLYRSAALKDDLPAIITAWYYYPVTDMLANYGKPEEIYLALTQYEPLEPRNGFELILFYPSHGFLAAYSGTMGTGKWLQICPVKSIPLDDETSLLVWNPGLKTTFKEIAPKYGFIFRGLVYRFRPIEDYGETSTDMFYEQFIDPKNRLSCFEISSPWYQEP